MSDYRKGFIDGLRAYAHWKDGVEVVGTLGTTSREAIENVEATWNYAEPAAPVPTKPEAVAWIEPADCTTCGNERRIWTVSGKSHPGGYWILCWDCLNALHTKGEDE